MIRISNCIFRLDNIINFEFDRENSCLFVTTIHNTIYIDNFSTQQWNRLIEELGVK